MVYVRIAQAVLNVDCADVCRVFCVSGGADGQECQANMASMAKFLHTAGSYDVVICLVSDARGWWLVALLTRDA